MSTERRNARFQFPQLFEGRLRLRIVALCKRSLSLLRVHLYRSRGLRTRLKTGPAPAPSAATDRLRNRIKAAELEAEQIELALLKGWLDRQPPRAAASTAPSDTANVLMMLARYFDAGTLPPEASDALAALSRAVREAAANNP